MLRSVLTEIRVIRVIRGHGLHGLHGVILFLLMCSPVFAQSNWVEAFLDRYSASHAVAPPEQTRVLSLDTQDFIRLLLENNRDLIVNRFVPLSNLFLIGSLYRPFVPNFHVLGNVSHTKTPSSNLLAGAASLIVLDHDLNIGIDQTLPTGTVYSVDFDFNRSWTNSIFEVINPAYNGTVRYGITQHLLRDFGRGVNTAQIRIARNNERISELQFELQIIDQVSQALQSYWDLVFATEDAKVKQRSLNLALKTLADNKVQVEIGSMAPIDLVQAEAEVATRRDDLITSEYNIDELQNEVKTIISREPDAALAQARFNPIEPVRLPDRNPLPPLAQAIQFALENRREMKQATYDVDNQEINREYFKNQKKPILDFAAGYSHFGLGGTQTRRTPLSEGAQIIEVIPGGVGNMFSTLFRQLYPSYNAGFNLIIPLGNRAAEADYGRAVNEKELAELRKAATAQRIALEVRNTYSAVEMSRARVETATTARDLSIRRAAAEQTKFELGTSTVRFVLEEQRNMAQSETNYIQALVNYTKAMVAYDRAVGNTLTSNRIQFDTQIPRQPAIAK